MIHLGILRSLLKSLAILGLLIGSFFMACAIYFLALGVYESFILNDTVDYIILAVLVATVGCLTTAVSTLIFRWANCGRAGS
jgi:hypothetical protein